MTASKVIWRLLCLKFSQAANHDANQLDGKQRHIRFNYYEYDMSKFGTPGWEAQRSLDRSRLNLQEHFEDLEHDQARHQGIHDHGWMRPNLLRVSVFPQRALEISPFSIIVEPSDASQVPRGYKSKSTDKMKIYWLTYVCDCQEWRNDHYTDILTPHDPTTIDLFNI